MEPVDRDARRKLQEAQEAASQELSNQVQSALSKLESGKQEAVLQQLPDFCLSLITSTLTDLVGIQKAAASCIFALRQTPTPTLNQKGQCIVGEYRSALVEITREADDLEVENQQLRAELNKLKGVELENTQLRKKVNNEAGNERLREDLSGETTAIDNLGAVGVENQQTRKEQNDDLEAKSQEECNNTTAMNSQADLQEEEEEEEEEEEAEKESGELRAPLQGEPSRDSQKIPSRTAAQAARLKIANIPATRNAAERRRGKAKPKNATDADDESSVLQAPTFIATSFDSIYRAQCASFINHLGDMIAKRANMIHCIVAAKMPKGHSQIRSLVTTIKKKGGQLECIFRNFLHSQHSNQQFQELLQVKIIDFNGSTDQIIRGVEANLNRINNDDTTGKIKATRDALKLVNPDISAESALYINPVQLKLIENATKLASADYVCSNLLVKHILAGKKLREAQAQCPGRDMGEMVVVDLLAKLRKVIEQAIESDRSRLLAAVNVVLYLIEGLHNASANRSLKTNIAPLWFEAQNYSFLLGTETTPKTDDKNYLFIGSNLSWPDAKKRAVKAAVHFLTLPILEEFIEKIFAHYGLEVKGFGEMLLHMAATDVADQCGFLVDIKFYNTALGDHSPDDQRKMKEFIHMAIDGKNNGGSQAAYANMYQFIDLSKQHLPNDADVDALLDTFTGPEGLLSPFLDAE